MNTKTITLKGKDYIITIEELGGSYQGKVQHDDKWIVKMEIPKLDAADIEYYRGENPSDLLFRILEGYVKSGFTKSTI
jgi:hypothetical protein